jgi:hypothetical protein
LPQARSKRHDAPPDRALSHTRQGRPKGLASCRPAAAGRFPLPPKGDRPRGSGDRLARELNPLAAAVG